MSRAGAVATALALLVAAVGLAAGPGGAAAAAPGAVAASPAVGLDAFAPGQQFDRVQFVVTVAADGSARWTFHYERVLENASERDQFEAFAAEFEANETTLFRDFRNQSLTLAREGEAATGRSMAAEDVSREARVVTRLNDIGVVEMSFTWVGFARVVDERVVVGDVFEGGLYVGPDQALVLRAGEGLAFRQVEPMGALSGGSLADSDTVTWAGEVSFTDNRPRAVLAPPGVATATGTVGVGSTGGGAGPGGDGGDGAGDESSVLGLAIVAVVVLAAAGLFLYRRRDERPAGGRSTVGGGGGGGAVAGGGPAVDDAALLDDEERVDGLLREHGGRMRQSAIVDATGWSKSKVSMVLSEMEEADQVRKLRVGRENIISLPGHEPEAARSSFDDGE